MIGKAYFAALIIANSQAVIQPNPAEIHQYEWVSASKFLQRIQTNPPEKQKIVYQAWVKLVIRTRKRQSSQNLLHPSNS
ncbi:hypothetical protein [Coleofasciculus sp. LEGE 07092]|uniref:hypothetical protein n=1 Tax=Coleofasciculus sp. LEGE 07092 TaxID=2777969 RepID=UPI0019D9C68D|nr:hypothetical protein [Coleofasciculus sp. LEGE 07092]MBE9151050.1 hypothetical protein [Coleofasciculus sp. LEGE 07092]